MKKLLFFLFIILTAPVVAQSVNEEKKTEQVKQDASPNESNVEMADKFRADGKIYVVIAVIAVILTGLFVYLILLDRKINRIENEVNRK